MAALMSRKRPRELLAGPFPCLQSWVPVKVPTSMGSIVIPRQNRRRELGLRPVVAAAVLGARGAVATAFAAAAFAAALATRTAVAVAAATAAAIAPRATAAAAAAAVTARAAIAARAAVAAAFARGTGVLQLRAGFLVDDAHRQADLAARVDLEDLDLDLLALAQGVANVLDALVPDLRDVDEAVLAAHEVHEGAEIDDVDDLAVVDLADLGLLDDPGDPLAGRLDLRKVGRRDLDHALVVDVDLGAGLRDDLADHLAAGADDVADLRLVDLHRLDPRRVGRKLFARMVERLGHLAEDVGASLLRLGERGLHDLLGDPGDLDVHLHRGDALGRAGDLEVHVAEMILVAEDVADHREILAFEDQAHRDSADRTGERNARVHHAQGSAADRGHRRGAVALGDVGEDPDRVRELVMRREHAFERAPRELAVPDLAPPRGAEAAHFADRIRREVVVEHEALVGEAGQAVDHLLGFLGAERGGADRLGLAAREQGRAVGAGKEADHRLDRADLGRRSAVDPLAFLEDGGADDLGLELLDELHRRHLVLRR